MRPPGVLNTKPSGTFCIRTTKWFPIVRRVSCFRPSDVRFPATRTSRNITSPVHSQSPPPEISSDVRSTVFGDSSGKSVKFEESIEKVIYGCRFLTILAVWGSLIGSFLCFIKGSTYVAASFQEFFVNRGKVIFSLVEAIDVYLLGTVMLVFGTGLYELFISNLDIAKTLSEEGSAYRSSLFGLFALKERPKWLEIKTVNELKTKLGHVIVMLLLIGLFDKSKKAAINSPLDLLLFSASVFLSSACLFLLSKLNGSK